MPDTSLDQDINFQPETKEYSYTKTPERLNLKFNIKIKPGTIFTLLFASGKLCLFVFVTLAILNFYNFIPLWNTYPKIFGFLPHKYDTSANKSILANVPYSQDYNGFYLEGTLINITSDKVAINYKGKIAEFLLVTNLKCEKMIITKLSNGDEKMTNLRSFCSDLLKIQNLNKPVNIVYQTDPKGFYVLENIVVINSR